MMMLTRFIAVLYEPQSSEDAAAAHTLIQRIATTQAWTRRFESAGMAIFDNGPRTSQHITVLPDAGGVVYGALFPAQGAAPVAETLRRHVHAEPSRRVDAMVRDCWGRYVALLDDRTSFPTVLRDPSGRSACHVLRLSGTLRIIFTEIEDILPFVRRQLAIDWTYARRFLTEHLAATRMTAIRDVAELLPGESFTLLGGVDTYRLVWNPASFATDRIDDFEEASRSVRDVAQFCADRWTEQFGRVVLSLSGGLDSSVIAGLLRRAPATESVLCRNLYSDSAEADERIFAKQVADQHGFELVTGQHGTIAIDLDATFRDIPITLNPSRMFSTVAAVKDRQQFLDQTGASSFWSGFAGDQVFAAERSIAIARDYVRDRAVPVRLLQVARDVSEITGTSISTVLRAALKSESDKQPSFSLPAASFLNDAPLGAPANDAHPIAAACRALPPAKANHIMSVVMSLAANPFEKVADRPVIDFYASQPLMETCFRIPTYIHNQGGLRRALQRHAFADLLPDEVRTRRGKASSAGDVVSSLLSPRNTRFLRSRIERGHLVENGILDPARTSDVVAFTGIPARADLNALISCIAVEDWAAKWQRALAS